MQLGAHRRRRERTTKAGSGSSYGYDLDSFTLAGGTQHEVARDAFAGVGASYQRVNLNARYSGSDGDQFDVSAIVKKQVEATKYEVSAGVGYGRYDSHRYIDLTGSLVADSHQHVYRLPCMAGSAAT